jgi:DNA-binding MarR family transcriptional regulator
MQQKDQGTKDSKRKSTESEIIPSNNIRRLLKNLNDAVDLRLSEFLQGTAYEKIRPSDASVISNVDRGYSSVASISKLQGISRQAVHMSAMRLQEHGMVELLDAPNNKRDKRIVITPSGYKQLRRLAKEIEASDAEFADVIGSANLEKFRKQLSQLEAFLVARRKDMLAQKRK